jgi:hypothetical protein
MPYSGPNDPDLPSNVAKMTDKEKTQWVDVFNSTYESCTKDGGDTKGCEGEAMKTANGVLKKEETIDVILASYHKVREAFENILHTLVPKKNALSLDMLWNSIAMQGYEMDDWAWLINIYQSGSETFAIFAVEGKLWKATISIDTNDNATLPPRKRMFSEYVQWKMELQDGS